VIPGNPPVPLPPPSEGGGRRTCLYSLILHTADSAPHAEETHFSSQIGVRAGCIKKVHNVFYCKDRLEQLIQEKRHNILKIGRICRICNKGRFLLAVYYGKCRIKRGKLGMKRAEYEHQYEESQDLDSSSVKNYRLSSRPRTAPHRRRVPPPPPRLAAAATAPGRI
jgi:hypothetical protein